MPQIKLNQALKRIEVSDLQIESELAFAFFDSIPSDERDASFVRALQIGVLALKQDRLSSFLSKTTNELGTELESLKMLFDMKAELFARSSVKGAAAETDIADFLTELAREHGLGDRIDLTGTTPGAISRNKTGDILCFVDEDEERKVVIECKFDKGVRFGAIGDQDWYGRNLDTALGQLVEARANRDCSQAIIVFDRSSVAPALLKRVQNVSYAPGFGFVVVVDSLRGDFGNLGLAYLLARDLACADRSIDLDPDLLMMLIERIIADAGQVAEIRKLVQANIATSEDILARLDKGLISLEFCRSYLRKFLNDGTLTKADLLDFYGGGDSKAKLIQMQAIVTEMTKAG